MMHQHKLRFWWAASLVIIGGCESLALLTSKTIRSVYHPITSDLSDRHLSTLRSSSPVYYQDACDEIMVETPPVGKPVRKDDPQRLEQEDPNTLSIPLIQYICANQATLLLIASSATAAMAIADPNPMETISNLHWNEFQNFHSLFDWQLSSDRLFEGILASFPLIGVGRLIETSDHREASRFNFATTNMVISLFGRRQSTMEPTATPTTQVMGFSGAIAISSGISEEMIFRGYIPAAIATTTHSPIVALFGQAALFAIGHLSKESTFGENQMNLFSQFLIGLYYGIVYLATGGDVLPCIVAHVLYDMHTLCETWTQVNNQMDYTQASSLRTSIDEEESLVFLATEKGIKLNQETVNFARHFFYAFDFDRVGSLSLSDCQRAVSYAYMKDSISPDPQAVKDLFLQATASKEEGRLDFSSFLQILVVLRSNSR